MNNSLDQITLLDDIAILTAAVTVATTGIFTSNAHGLKNGDRIVLSTDDTLPAGLSATTVYTVVKIDANTFYVTTEPHPSDVYIKPTDTGTGNHAFTMHDVCIPLFVEDFDVIGLSFASDGGGDAEMVIKIQGSDQDTAPDFSAAQTVNNMFDYLDCNDLEDGASIDGDTGIVYGGADDYRRVEVNVNRLKWLSLIISGYVAGEITVKAKCAKN